MRSRLRDKTGHERQYILPERTHACVLAREHEYKARNKQHDHMTVRGSRTDGRREESAAPLGSGSARGMGKTYSKKKRAWGSGGWFVCTKNERKGKNRLASQSPIISIHFFFRNEGTTTQQPAQQTSKYYATFHSSIDSSIPFTHAAPPFHPPTDSPPARAPPTTAAPPPPTPPSCSAGTRSAASGGRRWGRRGRPRGRSPRWSRATSGACCLVVYGGWMGGWEDGGVV